MKSTCMHVSGIASAPLTLRMSIAELCPSSSRDDLATVNKGTHFILQNYTHLDFFLYVIFCRNNNPQVSQSRIGIIGSDMSAHGGEEGHFQPIKEKQEQSLPG
jgi:hypothetical protein